MPVGGVVAGGEMSKIVSMRDISVQMVDGQWVEVGPTALDGIDVTVTVEAAPGLFLELLDSLGWRPWLERPLDCLVRWVGGQEDGHEG